MSIHYVRQLDTIVVKKNKEITLVNGSAFRKHCTRYGIPMKNYKDLMLFFQMPRYLPQEIYGCL